MGAMSQGERGRGPKKSVQEQVRDIQTLVPRVAQAAQAQQQAMSAEESARAQLLENVLSLVQPALFALVGRIKVAQTVRYAPDLKRAVETSEFARLDGEDVRGVHIAGTNVPVEDMPEARKGNLKGKGLWYLDTPRPQGQFLELAFRGTYEAVAQDEGGFKDNRAWTAELRVVTLQEAARAWGPAEIVETLHATLSKLPLEKMAKAAEKRQADAEVLRAVLTLLRR